MGSWDKEEAEMSQNVNVCHLNFREWEPSVSQLQCVKLDKSRNT